MVEIKRLDNRIIEPCNSQRCRGEERVFERLGNGPFDKKSIIYACMQCGDYHYKRENRNSEIE